MKHTEIMKEVNTAVKEEIDKLVTEKHKKQPIWKRMKIANRLKSELNSKSAIFNDIKLKALDTAVRKARQNKGDTKEEIEKYMEDFWIGYNESRKKKAPDSLY